jgi:hypothetical protein
MDSNAGTNFLLMGISRLQAVPFAYSATKLSNAKTINGVAFDGTANITVPADAGTLTGTSLKSTVTGSSLTTVGTLTDLTVTNPIAGSITGNAATATSATTATTASTVITNANLTGPVTSVGNATSIASGAITNAMLANTAVANLTGTNTGDQTSVSGNAGTATKLATARNINGVAFDGSGDINISAAVAAEQLTGTTLKSTVTGSSLTSVGTLTNLTVTNPIAGSITGNAATATTATSATTATTASTVITNANLTGPVTSVGNATSIASGAITNAMLANSAVANLTGTNTGDQTTVSGNAGTATKLATARNINGVAFDGTGNITVPADAGTLTGTSLKSTVTGSSLTSVGTLTDLTVTNPIAGSITGNAATATIANTVTTNANLTGLVSSVGNATSIADGAITDAKIAAVAGSKVSGNISGNAANVTGTVAVANGGTGATTLTANNVLLGNGTNALQAVAPGTSGNVLTSNGTTWASTAPSGGLPTGTVSGEMLYWNSTDAAWVKVSAGSNGQNLTFYNGAPIWIGAFSYSYAGATAYANTVLNPKTGKIWMDRNLGATQVATLSDDAAAYGDLYQWGRGADGHQIRTSATTITLFITGDPANGNFITSSGDWRSTPNDNLWQGVAGVNNPCPTGYRIPTDAEWNAELQSWSPITSVGALASPLKLPMAGYRNRSNGSLVSVGTNGYYWSSTVSSTVARSLFFRSGSANMDTSSRDVGNSVRCIKD